MQSDFLFVWFHVKESVMLDSGIVFNSRTAFRIRVKDGRFRLRSQSQLETFVISTNQNWNQVFPE